MRTQLVDGLFADLLQVVSNYRSIQGRSKLDNWGGMIFIYSYSAQLISFEIDCFYGVWTRIYEYQPPPPIIELIRRGRGGQGGHVLPYRQDPSENWKFDILSEFLRSSFFLYYAILIYEREIYFSTMWGIFEWKKDTNEMQIGLKSIVFPALYDQGRN